VRRRKILFIFGTRPEAIKLCPVIRYFREHSDHLERTGASPLCATPEIEPRICVTAQHRDMLDQVLNVFGIEPHHDLNAMREGQSLGGATSRILAAVEPVVAAENPDLILVQGDTSTTLCGALAGFYAGVPVGHVEAGLRTGDLTQPFPEEMNRVVVSRLSQVHFAATKWAASNLRGEGVAPESICVTGNTGIDAVLHVRDLLARGELKSREWPGLDPSKRLILVTAHRRESFGEGFEQICQALRIIADAREDVQVVYPVHPNPNVTEPVRRNLAGHPRILLIEPLDYIAFVDLMRRAYLLVTDSGGVQEEAPSLGKPVLVLREKTERPEAVEAGTAKLVGTDVNKIVGAATRLLEDADEYERHRRVHNPYGDGRASERIAGFLTEYFVTASSSSGSSI
jgi:UDP-N-acetylglucosamine 2-epimerase (non-hydrolysing)